MTSYQLRALTQVACTLLGFERTVRELAMNMAFVDFTRETPGVKGTIYLFFYIACMHTKLFNLITMQSLSEVSIVVTLL